MLNLFEILHRAFSRHRNAGAGASPQWWRDPLSHPDLQRMSQTELADLPFDPAQLCTDEVLTCPVRRPVAQRPRAPLKRSARPAIAWK